MTTMFDSFKALSKKELPELKSLVSDSMLFKKKEVKNDIRKSFQLPWYPLRIEYDDYCIITAVTNGDQILSCGFYPVNYGVSVFYIERLLVHVKGIDSSVKFEPIGNMGFNNFGGHRKAKEIDFDFYRNHIIKALKTIYFYS